MAKSAFLTAQEAAAELGVSLATLYAYVSRGLIRSEAVGDKRRRRRYRTEDIQRLKERKELRRNPTKTTDQALHWGIPVLESGLTLISNGRMFYRGQDALVLALGSSLEEVAWLLWTGELGEVPAERASAEMPAFQSSALQWEGLAPIHALQSALIKAEAHDPAALDLRPERVAAKGISILHLFARIAVRKNDRVSPTAAKILQAGWVPSRPEAAGLLNAALVLCADHELNVSAFTARCVASAGSSPYAAVVAGLAAFQGVKHGNASRRVEALFQEVGNPSQARTVLSGRLKRGEAIPGFGHPLYPEGDPRARLLLELVRDAAAPKQLDLAEAIAENARLLMNDLPTIDFALVCLARGLELPEEAAILLFAIGRTVGWVAHAIEQYQTNALIRPRARYTGPQP
jgi:citrate synthase